MRTPLVLTVHVVLCPNGARYLWNERRACARKIEMGCLAVGHTTKGCGHLGNGDPVGPFGFARAMFNDRRERADVRGCHRVVAPSNWMGQHLAARGTPRSNITVVEPPIASPPSVAMGSPEVPVLTFVGRLVDFKGTDQLIRCSALLDFDHRVVIVGKGPMEEKLRQLTSDLRVEDNVSFRGQLSRQEVDTLRLQSSVVVVPSLWPEIYGMMGPDALPLGIRVVGYRVGGSAEWLALGGALAVAVEPGDVRGLAHEISRRVMNPTAWEQRHSAAGRVHERPRWGNIVTDCCGSMRRRWLNST